MCNYKHPTVARVVQTVHLESNKLFWVYLCGAIQIIWMEPIMNKLEHRDLYVRKLC